MGAGFDEGWVLLKVGDDDGQQLAHDRDTLRLAIGGQLAGGLDEQQAGVRFSAGGLELRDIRGGGDLAGGNLESASGGCLSMSPNSAALLPLLRAG